MKKHIDYEIKKTLAVADEYQARKAPPFFAARVMAEVNSKQPKRWFAFQRIWQPVGVTAMLALVALTGMLIGRTLGERSDATDSEVFSQSYALENKAESADALLLSITAQNE